MADSETSSSNVVEYQNSNGQSLLENKDNVKKQLTTDTDYYFNMIANPSKIIQKKSTESESSEMNNIIKDSDSSSSSKSSSSKSSKSSRSSKSNHSSKNSSDSRPKYESISITPPKPQPNISFSQPKTNMGQAPVTEVKTEEPKVLTSQELRMKKIELLRKLCEIKSKGFELSKDYSFDSSLEEMEYEYELLKSFVDKRNGVKIFKNGLLQAVSVIEFLNDKYDPFDFYLSGWGEHMSVEVDNWEDVFEEIYEKYKGTGKKMAPEVKLLYLIVSSASAFHFSKSQSSKLPGLDSILASNPGLLSKIMNPGKGESSRFMSPQELNLEKQKELMKKKDADAKQQQNSQQNYIRQLQEQLQKQNDIILKQNSVIEQTKQYGTLNPTVSVGSTSEPHASNYKPIPPPIPASQLRPNVPNIRAPDQVKDILSRIHSLQPSTITATNTETQDETSSNDRLVSDVTLSESKKKGGRKPKKSNISIM